MPDAKDDAQEQLTHLAIQTGARYRHYKGGEYEVVACAIKEDTLEPLVIYRNVVRGSLWARTLTNWNENVTVNGTSVKRFARL